MSVNILEKFNSENDSVNYENEFVAADRNFVYINDINNNNYQSGFINFNSQNVIGHDAKRVLAMNNGFMVLPFGCVVSCWNVNAGNDIGTFGGATGSTVNSFTLQSNFTNAVSLKMQHHIFNQISNKFGNQVINQPIDYYNVYANERIKRLDEDKYQLYGDLCNLEFDSSKSYGWQTVRGEYNNFTWLQNAQYASNGTNNTSYVNEGHLNRMLRNNFDTTATNTLSGLDTSQFITEGMKEGFVGVILYDRASNTFTANLSQVMTYQTPIVGLIFQYVAVVPMGLVSQFYEELPSIVSLNNFEIKLQTNLANQNYWQVRISTAANSNGIYGYGASTSNQAVGQSCPFLLSNCSQDGKTGIQIKKSTFTSPNYSAPDNLGTDFADYGLTVSPFIGYVMNGNISVSGSLQTLRINSTTSSVPCRIWIPSLALTSAYMDRLLEDKVKDILFNDFIYDFSVIGVGSGVMINKQLTFQTGRIRNLYIVPYISNSVAANQPVPCYQSLVSSAPTTCSYSKISELSVYLGSVNVFFEPLSLDVLQYNATLINQNEQTGNSLVADKFKGRIKFSDWKKCYGVICVDLCKAEDQVNDDMNKQIQIKFKNSNSVPMDYLFILEFQQQFSVDRLTGQIVGSTKL